MIKESFTKIGITDINITDLNKENIDNLQDKTLNNDQISKAIGYLGQMGANPSLFFNIKIKYVNEKTGHFIILDKNTDMCRIEENDSDIDGVFQNFFTSYNIPSNKKTEYSKKIIQIINFVKENRKQIIEKLCEKTINYKSKFTELNLHEETEVSTDIDDYNQYTDFNTKNSSLYFLNSTLFLESFTSNLTNSNTNIFFQEEFMEKLNDLFQPITKINITVYYLLFQLLLQFPRREQIFYLEDNEIEVINLIRYSNKW